MGIPPFDSPEQRNSCTARLHARSARQYGLACFSLETIRVSERGDCISGRLYAGLNITLLFLSAACGARSGERHPTASSACTMPIDPWITPPPSENLQPYLPVYQIRTGVFTNQRIIMASKKPCFADPAVAGSLQKKKHQQNISIRHAILGDEYRVRKTPRVWSVYLEIWVLDYQRRLPRRDFRARSRRQTAMRILYFWAKTPKSEKNARAGRAAIILFSSRRSKNIIFAWSNNVLYLLGGT